MPQKSRFVVYVKSDALRNFVLVSSFIIGILSICILATTLWMLIARTSWLVLTRSCSWYIPAAILAASNALGLVVAICVGLPAYYRQIRILGLTFSFALITMVILNIIAGSISLDCTLKIGTRAENLHLQAYQSMHKYGQRDYEYYTRAIDRLQRSFVCCGIDKPSDYEIIPHWNDALSYPVSCCREEVGSEKCGRNIENIKTKGCWTRYIDSYRTYLDICTSFGFISALIYLLFAIGIMIDTTTNRYTSLVTEEEDE